MRFTLNGSIVDPDVPPLARLLDVLRATFGLTGTKEGCGEGECGACTVLVDGQPVNACLVPVVHVDGCAVVTIEGLEDVDALQRAFVEEGAAQCGICTPGMIVAAAAIPVGADAASIRERLAGNLCRCTGYGSIVRAVLAAHAASAAGPPAPR
jgi:aerobic-type carbon monoxide dehydrogenase small subunit (CoxS/CutS family)